MRTHQELSKLTQNNLIREFMELEYRAFRNEADVGAARQIFAEMQAELAQAREERDAAQAKADACDPLVAARCEALQAENERLRELVKEAASAEISKLRGQLAEARASLKAQGK